VKRWNFVHCFGACCILSWSDITSLRGISPTCSLARLLVKLGAMKIKLEHLISALDALTPLAKAVPSPVGGPLEGALESTGRILKYAQVQLIYTSITDSDRSPGGQVEQGRGKGASQGRNQLD
jgi:hypothetical protein